MRSLDIPIKFFLKRTFDASRKNSIAILIFVSALVLRLTYIFFQGSWRTGDSYDYLRIAKNIAFYFSFSLGKSELTLSPTAFRPPLYPLLLSFFFWVDYPPVYGVIILQAFLGTLTVSLVFAIAVRHFDKRIAVVAAFALIIEPFTLHYTTTVMTETLFTFLVLLGVFLTDGKKYILAGIIFGLATLTRPTIALFLVALVFLSVFSIWSTYRKTFGIILVFAALTVSFWTVRNAILFNEFIPVSTTGYGYNLLCGTLDVPMLNDEGWAVVKNDPAIKKRLENLRNGWTESQADRELLREAFRRIYRDPISWLKVRAKQYTRLYIDSAPYLLGTRNIPIREAVQNGNWFFILFKILLVSRVFIAAGLSIIAIVLLRKRLKELIHIVSFPVFLMLVHIPLWTENRYLLPIAPFVCILAAYTLVTAFDKVKNIRKPQTEIGFVS